MKGIAIIIIIIILFFYLLVNNHIRVSPVLPVIYIEIIELKK